MKLLFRCCCVLAAMLVFGNALARDDIGDYSIADVQARDDFESTFGNSVRFYFGAEKHPAVIKKIGRYGANKKTNAFNKSDEAACQWAFMSALKSLRDRAVKEGGNAVINITSNYRDNETSSEKTFKCGAGHIMAGVALKGTVVTVE